MGGEERQLLDARVELALAVRRQREASHLSQKQLGERLKTSQPRIAKIERAASDVSLDQLVRAFTAAGGNVRAFTAAGGKLEVKVAKGKKPSRTALSIMVATAN